MNEYRQQERGKPGTARPGNTTPAGTWKEWGGFTQTLDGHISQEFEPWIPEQIINPNTLSLELPP